MSRTLYTQKPASPALISLSFPSFHMFQRLCIFDSVEILEQNFPSEMIVIGKMHLSVTRVSHIFGGRLISLGTIIESSSGGRAWRLLACSTRVHRGTRNNDGESTPVGSVPYVKSLLDDRDTPVVSGVAKRTEPTLRGRRQRWSAVTSRYCYILSNVKSYSVKGE